MKPNWDDAPEWANYFAWDSHGTLFSEEDMTWDGSWWGVAENESRFKIVDNDDDKFRGVGKVKRP